MSVQRTRIVLHIEVQLKSTVGKPRSWSTTDRWFTARLGGVTVSQVWAKTEWLRWIQPWWEQAVVKETQEEVGGRRNLRSKGKYSLEVQAWVHVEGLQTYKCMIIFKNSGCTQVRSASTHNQFWPLNRDMDQWGRLVAFWIRPVKHGFISSENNGKE